MSTTTLVCPMLSKCRSRRPWLLINENLSPVLARWVNESGLFASAVIYVGLQGKPDINIWRYAYENDLVVVRVNVEDFIVLANGVDLHPGTLVEASYGCFK